MAGINTGARKSATSSQPSHACGGNRILIFAALMPSVFCAASLFLQLHYYSQGNLIPPQLLEPNPFPGVVRTPHRSILDIPEGDAVALPSIRVTQKETKDQKIDRGVYGGHGDKKHLGGFTDIDEHGISPVVWKDMIEWFGVKSVLDVGCGRGISTSWFDLHGAEVLCVEGSHDAIKKNILPGKETKVVEHDFSRGPWWPPKTYDAVWCVEFLEHVGRNYHQNYIPVFRKAAFIFATHSHWGGWHHVEVHKNEWWIAKLESYGFRYSAELTDRVRRKAIDERQMKKQSPTGTEYNAQHIWLTMQVFINPMVASLPEHGHLFSEHGCQWGKDNKECGTKGNGHTETPLPDEYKPLNLTIEMDEAWVQLIKQNIKSTDTKK